MAWSHKGHLVVGRECGIDVLDDKDEFKVIKSVDITGRAFSVVPYKTDLIIAIHPQIKRSTTTFVTWNREYEETRRWVANVDASDITIANHQIIVSSQASTNLKRFTLAGNILPDIEWDGESAGIVGLPSATIAFADPKRCTVHRKLIGERLSDVLWTVDVIKPFAMCVDDDGCLWVRSNKYDCLTLISPQGIKIQDIMGEQMMTADERRNPNNWFGMRVHNGYLYIGHDDGVGRYELSYDSV
ncbi:uncharacterized protein [Watersipora subatra]|uniref:uncharacterized protein n=1 Tax=Watersipora subatra TaxID=2589382 RepID=UPI00355B2FA7